MNAWLMGDFRMTKIFVIAFLVDFAIRIVVNPRYSPSMILGRVAVRHQAPEWTGAPQKRFAWAVAFALAMVMFYLIVVNDVIGPINLLVCASCLTLMFFESAFGICLACKVYNACTRSAARHCPGGTCDSLARHDSQRLGLVHASIVVLFVGAIDSLGQHWFPPIDALAATAASPSAAPSPQDGCTPPDWAVAMGHAEIWKLHNHCK
jgi:hypothetical protein